MFIRRIIQLYEWSPTSAEQLSNSLQDTSSSTAKHETEKKKKRSCLLQNTRQKCSRLHSFFEGGFETRMKVSCSRLMFLPPAHCCVCNLLHHDDGMQRRREKCLEKVVYNVVLRRAEFGEVAASYTAHHRGPWTQR